MKRARWMAALLAGVQVLTLAGCGSKDESADGGNRTLNAVKGDMAAGVADNSYQYAAEGEAYLDYDMAVGEGTYAERTENAFISTAEQPVSTFSADVDTASYSNVRRMIRDGWVDPDAVRIEEMVNYFGYSYPAPEGDAPLSVTTELSACPWEPSHELLLIGLQAQRIDLSDRAPMNLVFLVDVSGSMYWDGKLPLVQKALHLLAGELRADDRISLVTYADGDRVVLEGVSGTDTLTITDAVDGLEAGGSTAGAAGIERAYQIAQENFIEGGNNRVLLCTDGDLNVGPSTPEELTALIEAQRKSGVYLSVLGFGTDPGDDRMEALADNGNGNYAYIDSEVEARKVLVQEMGGTFYTVAGDVKLQCEFSQDAVDSYRLIGYENRILSEEDFDDDTVDAGEIGSGHSVTALYEIVPAGEGSPLGTFHMRYKDPGSDDSKLIDTPLPAAQEEQIPRNSAFAAAVAEFGMLLSESSFAGSAGYSGIRTLLAQTDLQDAYRQEFSELVEEAYTQGLLPEGSAPAADPGAEAVLEKTERTADYEVRCVYKGRECALPDADALIDLAERSLNAHTQMQTLCTTQDVEECETNGLHVTVAYQDYGAEGKEMTLEGAEKPYYLYGIEFLLDDTHAWLVLNNGGTLEVHSMPDQLYNALDARLWEMEE
ncbi:MAG: von Willebrand factor type A domain-containing protein [Oscillospiraceae bacterium]|nr:von Willebrand factor type A domain-containing protein [Oscillospiraceae bacterium]